jgi:K+-transporting ATPase c subunit
MDKKDQMPAGSEVPERTSGETNESKDTSVDEGQKKEESSKVSEDMASLQKQLDHAQSLIGKKSSEIDGLKKQLEAKSQAQQKEEPKNFDAIEEELLTKLDEGELGLKDALRQMNRIATERGVQLATEQYRAEQNQAKSQEAIDKFIQENPDFEEMKANGDLEVFKKNNPIHDDFSAFLEAKQQQTLQTMEEKIAEARKAGEEDGMRIASESSNASKVLGKKGDEVRDKPQKLYSNRSETKQAMADALKRSREA